MPERQLSGICIVIAIKQMMKLENRAITYTNLKTIEFAFSVPSYRIWNSLGAENSVRWPLIIKKLSKGEEFFSYCCPLAQEYVSASCGVANRVIRSFFGKWLFQISWNASNLPWPGKAWIPNEHLRTISWFIHNFIWHETNGKPKVCFRFSDFWVPRFLAASFNREDSSEAYAVLLGYQ